MKKWITILLVVVVGAVAVLGGLSYMGVQANDTALAEIQSNEKAVALSVSGMD